MSSRRPLGYGGHHPAAGFELEAPGVLPRLLLNADNDKLTATFQSVFGAVVTELRSKRDPTVTQVQLAAFVGCCR